MAGCWGVLDTEGRIYGEYHSQKAAQEALFSASRAYPWRVFRVALVR